MKFKILTFITVAMFLITTSILFPLGGVGKAKATATYGSATAADLLSGKTATVDAGQITGTMPNKVGSATMISPGTLDKAIPQGYYDGTVAAGKVLGDPNLIAGNIISGRSIFGIPGTAPTITVPVSYGNSNVYEYVNTVTAPKSSGEVRYQEVQVTYGGTYKVEVSIAAGNYGSGAYARIKVNGVQVQQSICYSTGATAYSYSVPVKAGDRISAHFYENSTTNYGSMYYFKLAVALPAIFATVIP